MHDLYKKMTEIGNLFKYKNEKKNVIYVQINVQ